MLQLPNGCHCSNPSISPKNWKTVAASAKKDWYIQYYFYDPRNKLDNGKIKPKLIIYKGGINQYKTTAERKSIIKKVYDELLHLLQIEGFNPIAGTKYIAATTSLEIEPTTRFIIALRQAFAKIKIERSTYNDIKCTLKQVEKAASELNYTSMYISDIRRKHIKTLLDHLQKTSINFSAHKYNKTRINLMLLFKELLELEAVDTNPIREISKMKITQRLRVLLTEDERIEVDAHLKKSYPEFWRFLHIFFHSGARECELLKIKVRDINVARQTFKVTVNKGRGSKEMQRTIKNIALPLWVELIEGAKADDYIFSRGLKPGPDAIHRDQITRRWRMHVKEKLGIKADLYSLKHLNLDETAALLDINAAAAQAGHTSTVITMKHYTLGEKERQHNRLKGVANGFV